MKKISLLILCLCLLSSCYGNREKTMDSRLEKNEEAPRYAVQLCGGRDEFYANSTLYLYVTPAIEEKAINYQLKSRTLERLENNRWVSVEETIYDPNEFGGIGWRFVDQAIVPFMSGDETTFRMKFHISDKLGEVDVYSPEIQLINQILEPEKMESTAFLSLYPYSLYHANDCFVQDETVTAEEAMVLVEEAACKVIGEVNQGFIKKSVTCKVLDNDACPIALYQDFLPEDDTSLTARKTVYFYDDGPLFETETITGKAFKELLAEFEGNESIPIPVCLIEGQNNTEDRLNSYGYRFYDEKADIIYELYQSTMYPGIDFCIRKGTHNVAHAFLFTEKKLRQ
ncbi:hypothetical protein [Holdemania massiliensis]|uniref:hypothetical protein n=1 Tax=Holdemania massiliensis TaxID=1468449 RepID=UPI00356A4DA1